MTAMVRKQIYIEPRQELLLKQLADKTGISEAEIIRQAIDRHAFVRQSIYRDLSAWELEESFIADLITQGPVAGERTWKREDLYE